MATVTGTPIIFWPCPWLFPWAHKKFVILSLVIILQEWKVTIILSDQLWTTIRKNSFQPSAHRRWRLTPHQIQVRNSSIVYLLGKVYDADILLVHVNNEKLTHKDKDKEKESISAQLPGLTGESKLELVDGFLISLQIVFISLTSLSSWYSPYSSRALSPPSYDSSSQRLALASAIFLFPRAVSPIPVTRLSMEVEGG